MLCVYMYLNFETFLFSSFFSWSVKQFLPGQMLTSSTSFLLILICFLYDVTSMTNLEQRLKVALRPLKPHLLPRPNTIYYDSSNFHHLFFFHSFTSRWCCRIARCILSTRAQNTKSHIGESCLANALALLNVKYQTPASTCTISLKTY